MEDPQEKPPGLTRNQKLALSHIRPQQSPSRTDRII